MNAALILSGGKGLRLGSAVPKQYLSVGGMMIVTRTSLVFFHCQAVDRVLVVAEPEWREAIARELQERLTEAEGRKFLDFAPPGPTRQRSIQNGLLALADTLAPEDRVLVHDAVRPFVTEELISACLDACAAHDGAMPVLPMKDTVYVSQDGQRVSALLDRASVFAGQAPEAFRFGKYLLANTALPPVRMDAIHGSTEPAILAGLDVAMLPGDEGNFKITTESDLRRFREVLGLD